MMPPARILFAGTPEFALRSLRTLHGAGYAIAAVITQPDRAAGRGRRLAASPVRQWASHAGLDLLQAAALARRGADSQLARLQRRPAGCCRLWRHPAGERARPYAGAGAVNVHASLLPRWRGASPVAAAILAGDAETGVTLMRMDAGLDTGPLLAARRTRIRPQETAGELEARLATLGAGLLREQLPAILAGEREACPQDPLLATHARRISKRQGTAGLVATGRTPRPLRAGPSIPGPWPMLPGVASRCGCGGRKRWTGRPERPGRILRIADQGMEVATVAGVLRVGEVQLPGRRRMPASDAARGAPLAASLLA